LKELLKYSLIVNQIKRLNSITDKQYLFGVLVLGLIIRGRQYLINRSLWLDEAFLAINIKERDFMQLLEPLDFSQVAPIGFLWIEKLMVNIFGLSELSLRFIPFAASILGIYIIYDLSRSFFSNRLALLIAFAYTVLPSMTYFSSEVKQYMTDVFSLLFLFWFYFKFVRGREYKSQLLLFGLIGAIFIWISNITIIILFSIGVAIAIDILKKFNCRSILYSLVGVILWLGSFYIYYVFFIDNHPHTVGMENHWAGSFMPHQTIDGVIWLYDKLLFVFKSTIGHYEMAFLGLALFITGICSVLFYHKRKTMLYLLLPMVVHLILSYFHIYPFGGRIVLYLTPVILIFEIKGIEFIAGFTKKKTASIIVLSFALLFLSILRVPYFFVNPMYREDIKPALQYVVNNKEDTDVVYIYSGSRAAFRFYKETYFSSSDQCVVGISSGDDYNKFVEEFDNLTRRNWLVFSHMNPVVGIEYIEGQILLSKQIDYFEAEGAKVYLIDK
jgi:hypothetical protein